MKQRLHETREIFLYFCLILQSGKAKIEKTREYKVTKAQRVLSNEGMIRNFYSHWACFTNTPLTANQH